MEREAQSAGSSQGRIRKATPPRFSPVDRRAKGPDPRLGLGLSQTLARPQNSGPGTQADGSAAFGRRDPATSAGHSGPTAVQRRCDPPAALAAAQAGLGAEQNPACNRGRNQSPPAATVCENRQLSTILIKRSMKPSPLHVSPPRDTETLSCSAHG